MYNNFKNTIVLNNLPSNIIDQAIIILKKGIKIKELEKVEKSKLLESENTRYKERAYIVKEAEMLVDNYINNIENKSSKEMNKLKFEKKFKKLKKITMILIAVVVLQFILLIS